MYDDATFVDVDVDAEGERKHVVMMCVAGRARGRETTRKRTL